MEGVESIKWISDEDKIHTTSRLFVETGYFTEDPAFERGVVKILRKNQLIFMLKRKNIAVILMSIQ